MDVKKFSGVYPAVITPFDAEGEVDVAKLENYINYLCDKVDGLFVGGSYGSGPIMTVAQRKTLAEVTIKTCAGRVPVIMHIGTTNLADTIELAQHAEKAGADALAAVTPFYYRHTPNVIKQYYADLINSVDLPVIAYNNPKYSNFCISGDFLAELADIGLQGIKDSSADISLFYDFMAKVDKEGFLFLIGSQTHLLPAVAGGAHGCVSGLRTPSRIHQGDLHQVQGGQVCRGQRHAAEGQHAAQRYRQRHSRAVLPCGPADAGRGHWAA